jgi:hypothetical protein
MTSHLLTSRALALSVAGLALGTAPALARPAIDPQARYSSAEAQVLASRGVGAPTTPVRPQHAAPRVQSADGGFDWGSAGVGAAATGGLVLIAIGGFGAAHRARIRLAR